MQNDRPLNDSHLQEAIELFTMICDRYDLAGAVTFINAKEMGFSYHLPATWNGIIDDPDTPLGMRIRFNEAELGRERAKSFAEGTAWVFGALIDFGTQTRMWGQDMLKMLRQAGMQVTHTPFGGRKLPRLTSKPPGRSPGQAPGRSTPHRPGQEG